MEIYFSGFDLKRNDTCQFGLLNNKYNRYVNLSNLFLKFYYTKKCISFNY